MYREILEYIAELGSMNMERQKGAEAKIKDAISNFMNDIGEDIEKEYGLIFLDSSKRYEFGENQIVSRYLTDDLKTEKNMIINLEISAERSLEKKARYCISIGSTRKAVHEIEDSRKRFYRFTDLKLQDDLHYMNKNLYKEISKEKILSHLEIPEIEGREDKEAAVKEMIEKKEDIKNQSDKKEIVLCYFVNKPEYPDDADDEYKNKIEEQLRAEVMKGVKTILPYYRYILDIPKCEAEKGDFVSKNNILYGPPGTGKTYRTAAYAVAICDGYDPEKLMKIMDHDVIMKRYQELELEKRVGFTTFHQSYGYEDFIEGIRPVLMKEDEKKTTDREDLEYRIEAGVFKEFCETAQEKKEPCVFIIDEINRGNISRIFGELITLIEESKRKGEEDERSVILPYSKTPFSVPANVYIIGTMNTADRSIALLDMALRRRFSFVEMMPRPEELADIKIEETGINVEKMLEMINKRIEVLYDREHTIGHAYFCGLKGEKATFSELKRIFKKSIFPLLQEYFFDDYEKIAMVLGDNQKKDSCKFITEDEVNVRELFGYVSEEEENLLQGRRYKINERAFDEIESYIQIYEN